MTNLRALDTEAKSVCFIRQSYDPAHEATSRSILELEQYLLSQGYQVNILHDEQITARRTKLGRIAFLWRVIRHLARIRYAAIVTLEDPTGIGLVAHWVGCLRRRSARPVHITWLMDINHIQFLRLGRYTSRRQRLFLQAKHKIDILSYRMAHRCVVLSEEMAQELVRSGIERVSIIPIWQNGREVQVQPMPQTPLIVGYFGHAAERHPLGLVVDLASNMQRAPKLKSVQFKLVGGGVELARVAAIVNEQNISNVTVSDRDSASSLSERLGSAHVHLVSLDPSATATCVPSKTYAAMAAGRPVIYIGSEDSQPARDITGASCGFVVGPNDRIALTAALDELMSDPDLLTAMGRRARTYFDAERDITAVGRMWCEFLADQIER